MWNNVLEGHTLQLLASQRLRTTFLARAAQYLESTITEVKFVNKRLKWKLENQQRGLRYVPLNLKTAKRFVFVDASL